MIRDALAHFIDKQRISPKVGQFLPGDVDSAFGVAHIGIFHAVSHVQKYGRRIGGQ